MIRNFTLSLVLAIVPTIACSIATAQTSAEKQAVQKIASRIDRAGRQFQSQKLDDAAESITDATKLFAAATTNASPALIELLKPEHARLTIAIQLLATAGKQLDPVPALPQSMPAQPAQPAQPGADAGATISFKNDVAKILVAKCGNCHVNDKKGGFNIPDYNAIGRSGSVTPGQPAGSHLIEVIESGEMPKGNLKVTAQELKVLKDWISAGAKFDGDNPNQDLKTLSSTAAAPPAQPAAPPQPKLVAAAPTGKETVSFGLHIAPILVENCAGCHMTDRPRSNLSLRNFAGLLAGGDGGLIIKPGDAAASPLYTQVNSGAMPPDKKLNSDLIAKIKTWIDEGAKFDGGDPALRTYAVAAVAKAGSQTHEELSADRQATATKNWKLVMGSVEGTTVPSQDFLIAGSTEEHRLAEISKLLETLPSQITSAFKTNENGPFVKGRASVFVFDKRYDFSEFGKMIEQRELPKETNGHWNYTITDAYAAVLLTRNQSASDAAVTLAQQLAALHIASLGPDVPRWFAEGMGYWAAKKIHSRDESMKKLDATAEAAASSMQQPDDFIQEKLSSDQAGLVSYLFIKSLKSKSANFNRLMADLQAGKSFESSFEKAYGSSPQQLLAPAKKKP